MPLIRNVLLNLSMLMTWLLILSLITLLLPIIILVFVLRVSEDLLYKHWYGENTTRLNAPDLAWPLIKDCVGQSGIIIGMMQLDGELSVAECRKLLGERMVNKRKSPSPPNQTVNIGSNAEGFLFPKVRQYMKKGFVNYYWVDDLDFMIENHVLEAEDSEMGDGSVVLRSDDDLQTLLNGSFSRAFRGASPWECLVVPKHVFENSVGVGNDGSMKVKKKTVLVFRLNHAIGDGSSLAYFLASSLGDYFPTATSITTTPTRPEAVAKGRFGKFSESFSTWNTMVGLWYLPSVYASVMARGPDQNVLYSPTMLNHKDKRVAWSRTPISLDKFKCVKNCIGGTVNDVFVGVLSKSLNDYFRIQNASPENKYNKSMTILNAVNLRCGIPSGFDNQITALTVPFPVPPSYSSPSSCGKREENGKCESTLDHIHELKATLDGMKARKEALGLIIGFHFIGFLLPACLLKSFFFKEINKTTGNVTNLVGPGAPLTLGGDEAGGGHSVELFSFWQPCICNQGLGVSFCSYAGGVRLSAQTDATVMRNPDIIIRLFENNFNQLLKDLNV